MPDPVRTLEVRWFLPGPLPAAVEAWFARLGPPVGPEARTDRYLAPTDDALGVKLRDGAVEPKRRDAVLGPLVVGRAQATAEAWAKWSLALAAPDGVPLADDATPEAGWVAVSKTRRQREALIGAGRCRLDLSEVTVGGAVWWSVCLEAEGLAADTRRIALGAGAARWLTTADAPELPAEAGMGYPAWLRSLV